MRAFKVLCLAFVAASLVACGGSSGSRTGSASTPTQLEPRTFSSVDQGTSSLITVPEDLLVLDQASWDVLWARHTLRKILITFPFPDVCVLATFEGQKPSDGFSSEVIRTGVDLATGDVHALVRTLSPGPFRAVSRVLTSPFHIVSVEAPTPVSGRVQVERQRQLDFVEVLSGPATPRGINDPAYPGEVLTVRSGAAFDALWRQHSPGTAVPAIDFAREMIVLVAGAFQADGGHSVEVLQLIEGQGEVRADFVVHPHHGSSPVPVGPEAPFQILRVALSTADVRAEDRQQLPVTELASGTLADFRGANGEVVVARDQVAFQNLLQLVGAGVAPATVVTPDFAVEQAVFVFFGERQIPGQAISVASASLLEDGEVDIEVHKSDPIRRPIAQRTSLFQIVKMPKTFGPARIRTIDVTP